MKRSLAFHFTKMQALGNDYIMIDESKGEVVEEALKQSVVRTLCTPHLSVGADGVVFICPPTSPTAGIRFRIFNSDGSEAQMCGNGIRCMAKYIHDRHLIPSSDACLIQTLAGLRQTRVLETAPHLQTSRVKVEMGIANFKPASIPMEVDPSLEAFLEREVVPLPGRTVQLSAVSIGNPHAVIFEADPKIVREIGPILEKHKLFPQRTNVHCVRVAQGQQEFWMETWERGVGYSNACGTGAAAIAAVAVKLNKLQKDSWIRAHMPFGDLAVLVRETEAGAEKQLTVEMEGEATQVFEGTITLLV